MTRNFVARNISRNAWRGLHSLEETTPCGGMSSLTCLGAAPRQRRDLIECGWLQVNLLVAAVDNTSVVVEVNPWR